MRKAITFGTFDLFHIGHVKLLKRARKQAGHLILGISSVQLSISKKGRNPIYPLASRRKIIEVIKETP